MSILVQQHQQQKGATAHVWHQSAATPREVRARLGPATAHGMCELVAKVGYSGRHGRTPRHIALTLGMGALGQIAVRK